MSTTTQSHALALLAMLVLQPVACLAMSSGPMGGSYPESDAHAAAGDTGSTGATHGARTTAVDLPAIAQMLQRLKELEPSQRRMLLQQAGEQAATATPTDRIGDWEFGTLLNRANVRSSTHENANSRESSGRLLDFPLPDYQAFQESLPKRFQGSANPFQPGGPYGYMHAPNMHGNPNAKLSDSFYSKFEDDYGMGGADKLNTSYVYKPKLQPMNKTQFDTFIRDLTDNSQAAAIVANSLFIASAISFTVSGALSIASVSVTAGTAIPVFLAGLGVLGLNTLSFVNRVAGDYPPGSGAGDLSNALAAINRFRGGIMDGSIRAEVVNALSQVRAARRLVAGLPQSNLGRAFRT